MFNTMKTAMLASVVAVGFVGSAGAATVQNGSFEAPGNFSGSYNTLSSGNNTLPGWTVTSGSVDLINNYWQNADGHYSLDMSGNGPGSISQTLTGLVGGQEYSLSFALAGNPDVAGLKTLLASVGGISQTFTFDSTGHTKADMGWVTQTLSFVATDTAEILSFTSGTNSAWGPALDNISVSQVPVPAAGLMLLTAFGGLAGLRRRKRKAA